MLTLLQTIQQLDIAQLQELIENGIDINQPCSNEELPLVVAIKQLFENPTINQEKAIQIIDSLLHAGANPDKVVIRDESLLHYLCRQGKRSLLVFKSKLTPDPNTLPLVEKLLHREQKININTRNKNSETPFLVALDCGNLEIAKLLLKQGAEVKTTPPDDAAIRTACRKNDLTLVKALHERKLDLNAEEKSGATALDYTDDPQIALFLLQNGGRSKQRNLLYFFHIAQQKNCTDLIEYLFKMGLASYRGQNGETALQDAKSIEMIESLLKNGALTHLKGNDIFRLLDEWFMHYRGDDASEVAQRLTLLQEYKADFKATDHRGNTLLHQAVHTSPTICQMLLKTGIAINAQNEDKQTALHQAARYLQVDTVKLLLAAGADSSLPDQKGLTALEQCTYRSVCGKDLPDKVCEEVFTPLFAQHSEAKLPQNTPDLLLLAVHCNSLTLLQALHARGADLHGKPKEFHLNAYELAVQGKKLVLLPWLLKTLETSPVREKILTDLLAMATQCYHHEVVGLLIQAGAKPNRNLLSIFINYLSMPSDSYPTAELRGIATTKTLEVLLESKIDINQESENNKTLLQELLDNRCHWSWIVHLINKGAKLPLSLAALMQLANLAAKHQDDNALTYIINQCPQNDWLQQILTSVALNAIRNADLALLQQLEQLGLKWDAPAQQHLLDELLSSIQTTAPISQSQQKLLVHFITQGVDLHRPATYERHSLLHMAAIHGWVEILELLLQPKYGLTVDFPAVTYKKETPLQLAVEHKQAEATLLLLQRGAKVDVPLLLRVIETGTTENILNLVIEQLPAQMLLESRLLHYAIARNNLLACQVLLKHHSKLMDMVDTRGRTPLHCATAPNKKAIYDHLLSCGADKSQRDYQGYDVTTYALCHDTLREAKSDEHKSTSPEFKKLRVSLLIQKEFSAGGEEKLFLLSLYCHNLISLFGTADVALKYIKQHQDSSSKQPIHDLCQFQLPDQGAWQPKAWAGLFLQHGTAVAKFLPWAPRLEQILKRSPISLAEIEAAAQQIGYARELENPSLAKLLISYKVPENAFNRLLGNYREKKSDHLPDIVIDGKEIKQADFYLKKLPPNDRRGFVLGAITHCCQSVGSAGEACALHGMFSPNGGFYAVFKIKDKEIKKCEDLYQQAEEAKDIGDFVDKLREKSQKNKYRNAVLVELRQQLKHEWDTAKEGEIIAQSWAWISQNGALVLDSWERLREENNDLCLPFFERLAYVAITRYGFKTVLLGKGGQTPSNLPLSFPQQTEVPKDYYDYRDSEQQYVLKTASQIATTTITEALSQVGLFSETSRSIPAGLILEYYHLPEFKL